MRPQDAHPGGCLSHIALPDTTTHLTNYVIGDLAAHRYSDGALPCLTTCLFPIRVHEIVSHLLVHSPPLLHTSPLTQCNRFEDG